MALIVKTINPRDLLSKIKKAIDSEEIRTWGYDSDGDFTHTAEQWNNKAWLSVKEMTSDKLIIGIIGQKDTPMSTLIYAIYHGRFSEMLLNHFDKHISNIEISSMPTKYDDITS